MTNSYIVAEDNVASKIIDQEAIAINLLTGDYFSFSGCAPVLWKLLMAGADLDQLLAAVRRDFDDVPSSAPQQLDDFLARLIAEQLVIPQSAPVATAALGPEMGERRRYEAPGIDKFDDMAMMLALDPPMPELPGHLGQRSAGKR